MLYTMQVILELQVSTLEGTSLSTCTLKIGHVDRLRIAIPLPELPGNASCIPSQNRIVLARDVCECRRSRPLDSFSFGSCAEGTV